MNRHMPEEGGSLRRLGIEKMDALSDFTSFGITGMQMQEVERRAASLRG